MKRSGMAKRFCLKCGHEISGNFGFNASSNHNRGCPYKTLVLPKKESKSKRGFGKYLTESDLEDMDF
jgi:hypothetical protein